MKNGIYITNNKSLNIALKHIFNIKKYEIKKEFGNSKKNIWGKRYDQIFSNNQNEFKRWRFDFTIWTKGQKPKLCFLIEYQGESGKAKRGHYTSYSTQRQDNMKEEFCKKNYVFDKLIKIPYFIQLNKNTIYQLFKIQIDFKNENKLKSGFYNPNGQQQFSDVLPDCFNKQGLDLFVEETKKFVTEKEQIYSSIIKCIKVKKHWWLVIPPELKDIVENETKTSLKQFE